MVKKILFQGDSITDSTWKRDGGLSDLNPGRFGYGYVLLTAAKLMAADPSREVICYNRGCSGHRIVDLYARWKIDAINLKPDMISILIGVNDTWHEFARQNGVEVERYETIYRMLLEWTVKELPEVKLVLCEPFALLSEIVTPAWLEEIGRRSLVVQKLAKEFNAVFVPFQEVLNEAAAKAGDNSRILLDGVHPTIIGAQIMSDQWLKCVEC